MAISGDTFTSLGGAVNDIFGGVSAKAASGGYKIAQAAYLKAADIYGQQAGTYAEQADIYGKAVDASKANARIAQTSTDIQEMQAQRQIYQAIGGEKADVGGAGLAESGSALDLLRSSTSQASLTMGLLRTQGAITQGGYEQEQLSYAAMGKAAEASKTASEASQAAAVGQAGNASSEAAALDAQSKGSTASGVLKIIGTVASVAGLFSDARLKKNITFLDRRYDGLAHYLFQYRSGDQWFVGLLAQEVEKLYPDAVVIDAASGFKKVNYDMVDDALYLVGEC